MTWVPWLSRPRCLQAQQPAAQHDRAFGLARLLGDGGAVFDGAEDEHSGLVRTRQRRHKRPGAGGNDDLVVGFGQFQGCREAVAVAAGLANDDALLAVELLGLDAGVQTNTALFIPVERVEQDGVGILETAQNCRQLECGCNCRGVRLQTW